MKKALPLLLGLIVLAGAAWLLARRAPPSPVPRPPSPSGAAAPDRPPPPPWEPPEPAETPAVPASSVAPDLDGFIRTFSAAMSGRRRPRARRFEFESSTGLSEIRAEARRHSRDVLEKTRPLLMDPTLPLPTRHAAVLLMSVLAREPATRREAQGILLQAARDPDPVLSEVAIHELASGDAAGEFRSAYLERAEAGSVAALRILGRWNDSGITAKVEQIRRAAETRPSEQGDLFLLAGRVLDWHRFLAKPDALEDLRRFLTDPTVNEMHDSPWALAAGKDRLGQEFPALLRRRLDLAARTAARDLVGRGISEPFDVLLARDAAVPGLDLDYDDVLVACSEAGGPLTAAEIQRLKTFGY